MESVRELFGAQPAVNDDGSFSPSRVAMAMAVPDHTDYHEVDYPESARADGKRILVLCTEIGRLTCENGNVFATGNHPGELFIVFLHLERAGFAIDLATPTGQPVPIESWAVPQKDDIVRSAMDRYADQLAKPLSMGDVLKGLDDDSPYVAVYVPGGHGAVLSVPDSPEAGGILRWFIAQDRYVVTICHGPAGLLSMTTVEDQPGFPLAGYHLAAFPDSSDKLLVVAGYLPGEMPYYFGERLRKLGVTIVNHLPIGSTHVDRKVLSGDSPFAANKLGEMTAHTLLESLAPAPKG